jgi:hypothetical protein
VIAEPASVPLTRGRLAMVRASVDRAVEHLEKLA